ncbi:MAG: hypothetical protein U0625_11440 [Phycisphaerales bacterium]
MRDAASDVPGNPSECRARLRSLARDCLRQVAARRAHEKLADAFAVRTAHAWLVLPREACEGLRAVETLARRCAAACERLRDRATPMSDLHAWTDVLDECAREAARLLPLYAPRPRQAR